MVLKDCSIRMIAASTDSSSRSFGDFDTGIFTLRISVVFLVRTPEAFTCALRAPSSRNCRRP